MRRAVLVFLAMALPLNAQGIEEADYRDVLSNTLTVVDFEILPHRPEPGYALDHGIAFAGGQLGSGFSGQTLVRDGVFDRLLGAPSLPLTLETGPTGRGLSLAFHRGFGSLALYPLGPEGFPAIEARGEGSAAILFDEDTCQVGMKVHSAYPDPLGAQSAPSGAVMVVAFARDGSRLGQQTHALSPGISAIALRSADGVSVLAGITLETTDPGGIALDDIVFGPCAQILG